MEICSLFNKHRGKHLNFIAQSIYHLNLSIELIFSKVKQRNKKRMILFNWNRIDSSKNPEKNSFINWILYLVDSLFVAFCLSYWSIFVVAVSFDENAQKSWTNDLKRKVSNIAGMAHHTPSTTIFRCFFLNCGQWHFFWYFSQFQFDIVYECNKRSLLFYYFGIIIRFSCHRNAFDMNMIQWYIYTASVCRLLATSSMLSTMFYF